MKKKFKWNNLVLCIIILISLICLSISIYNIIKYKIDEHKTKVELQTIENNTIIEEIIETNDIEIIENNETINESNPYWDYINMNLIDVDFSELKKINNNVKGWILVNGTNINYPFVQGNDNIYYLNHSFDNSYNTAGWVFLDYRNSLSNFNEKNTIIYAHGMKNKTMFGSLRNILTSGWLNNTDNYVIKLSTEYENTLWQVFSVYHIPTTSDYLQTSFTSNNKFIEFANMLINRSAYNFNTSITENDRILTLSTCYNKTDKVVLHAKLIKRESKIN